MITTADALIIGAGPAGLFQAFALGLLGLKAHILDALPFAGGQCAVLYKDKTLFDIPGTPACTGSELTERLLQQIQPFDVPLHLGHLVTSLTCDNSPSRPYRYTLETDRGLCLQAPCIVIAAGTGAFLPRKPPIGGLTAFEGQQVFYHLPLPLPSRELETLRDHRLLIMGDDDSALSQTLTLCQRYPALDITLLHRRDHWRAAPHLVEAIHHQHRTGRLHLTFGQVTGLQTEGDDPAHRRLRAFDILTPEGNTIKQLVDTVLPLLGLSPTLGPLNDWDLSLAFERKQILVNPATFEILAPQGVESSGLYAIGDINAYPGKRRLILSSFHEATLAAYHMAERHAATPVPTLYTTSSRVLQERLKINSKH